MSLGNQIFTCGKGRVSWVLVEGVDPSVSDGETCQVDPRILPKLEVTRNIWNVVTGETFSCEVDITTLKLGVLLHEIMKECVEIVCDRILAPSERPKLFNETEASS